MADLSKVEIRLHPQPRVGGAAERLFEPKRHFGRDGAELNRQRQCCLFVRMRAT
jgi:hypothetical protein